MDDEHTTSMTSAPDSHLAASEAGAALRRSDELAARTRRAGRWHARYMAVFGVGFGLLTLALGLGPAGDSTGPWWVLGLVVAWAAFVVVMVVWAVRRPVQGSLDHRVAVPGWVGTGLLYGATLFYGLGRGLPPWGWALASVAVALPLLVTAARVRRSLA